MTNFRVRILLLFFPPSLRTVAHCVPHGRGTEGARGRGSEGQGPACSATELGMREWAYAACRVKMTSVQWHGHSALGLGPAARLAAQQSKQRRWCAEKRSTAPTDASLHACPLDRRLCVLPRVRARRLRCFGFWLPFASLSSELRGRRPCRGKWQKGKGGGTHDPQQAAPATEGKDRHTGCRTKTTEPAPPKTA